MSGPIRRRLRLFGTVQGVGLRWRAVHAASLTGATGWIRNDADGSVALEIQAPEAQIDEMLSLIQRGAYVRVERMEARRVPVVEGERGFTVLDDGPDAF